MKCYKCGDKGWPMSIVCWSDSIYAYICFKHKMLYIRKRDYWIWKHIKDYKDHDIVIVRSIKDFDPSRTMIACKADEEYLEYDYAKTKFYEKVKKTEVI